MRSIIALLCLLSAHSAFSENKEEQRLRKSGEVLQEILDMPDAFPSDLLDKAECAVVLPSVKKFALGKEPCCRHFCFCSGQEVSP